MKPLTPEDVNKIPDTVIEVVNELLFKKYSKVHQEAKIMQDDIVDALIQRGYKKNEIFDNHLLDIEPLYQASGWKVVYDKPSYSESYPQSFTFTPKNKKS